MKDRIAEHQEAAAHKSVIEKLWSAPLIGAFIDRFPVVDGSTVLAAEARCGLVPMRWSSILSEDTRVIALDPSRPMLDVARQRIDEQSQRRIFFVPQRIDSLSYADGVFKAAVCLNGVHVMSEMHQGLQELGRVVEPGGRLVMITPGEQSFKEIRDMLDEALRSLRLDDAAERLAATDASFITAAGLYKRAMELGLHDISIDQCGWTVSFESGREALMSPLVRQMFLPHWLEVIRSSDRELALRYVVDAIDTYYHERTFTCTLTACCLTCAR